MAKLAEEPVGLPHDEPSESSATLCDAFQRTVALRADRPSLRGSAAGHPLSWRQYGRQVRDAAAALAAIGVKPGDTVGLRLVNRPEFHVLDMAALHLGATPFSIYNTSPPEQVAQRLGNADCANVITERALAPAAIAAGGARVFVIDDAPTGAEQWTEALAAAGPPRDADLHVGHERTPEGGRTHPSRRTGDGAPVPFLDRREQRLGAIDLLSANGARR
jgi:long-subunit acyl-CoA synthetase (AMP-forming)